MDPQHENPDAASSGSDESRRRPLSEQESLRKDMSYSPASESETQAKQADPLPDTVDPDIDPGQVRAVPGTGARMMPETSTSIPATSTCPAGRHP
ncbi:hypothetical protein ACI3KY_02270 [Microbacterium sp. ZW T2_14]|uniref:hypothetical protein n=1 Tax=Microbacterium sp. ZW T2_14 TaxID=3378079 RepID=UPI003854B62F